MHKYVLKSFGVRKITFVIVSTLLLLFIIAITKSIPTGNKSTNSDEIFKDLTYQKFKSFTQDSGVQTAYSLVKQKFPNNETSAHDFAHIVGLVSFDKNGPTGISICDQAYNYGCYHGFIEGFLLKDGIWAITQIESQCSSLGFAHTPSCIHGIGHGVMAHEGYDLQKALSDCDQLKQEVSLYCWDGVFMERISASMQDPSQKTLLSESNLFEPCDSTKKVYKAQCWRNQATAWFEFYNNNSHKVLSTCLKIDTTYRQICDEAVGLANVMIAGEDTNRLSQLCKLDGNVTDDCIMGELKEILFEGRSPALAQSLCNFTSEKRKNECQNVFQLHLAQYQTRFNR